MSELGDAEHELCYGKNCGGGIYKNVIISRVPSLRSCDSQKQYVNSRLRQRQRQDFCPLCAAKCTI